MKKLLPLIITLSLFHFATGQTGPLRCQKPPYLKPGDRVALLSPSYASPMEEVEQTAAVLRGWGLLPVIAPNVGKEYAGKYAGTVEERVADLRWALADTSIKAIICNRGGYGTIQYIDQIPLKEWAAHPKWLVGFSDITTLHGLLNCAGVMSIHGTMGLFLSKDSTSLTSTLVRDMLMGTAPVYSLPTHPQNIEGHASGVLVGGNLCTFAPNLGSHADFTKGMDLILFVEEVEETMHNIDRQFEILAMNGALDRCKGVILGDFTDCGNEFTYESVEAMLHERLAKYGIPLLCGFPAGHGKVNLPLVMGAPVTMEVRNDGSTLSFDIQGAQRLVDLTPPPPPVLLASVKRATKNAGTGKSHFYHLQSPDGRLEVSIQNDGRLAFSATRDGKGLIEMTIIGLTQERDGKEVASMTVKKTSRRSVDETIPSPFYRQASMRNHYNELTLKLKENLSVVFRAYDEGIAYRYVWEGKPGKVKDETLLLAVDEGTHYVDNPLTATVPYVLWHDSTDFSSQYNSSFENQYTTLPLRKLDPRRLCFLPLMLNRPDSVKICISESALLDYPGMYLRHVADGLLECRHAPLPKRVEQGGHNNLQLLVKEREDYIAEMDRSKLFPWRIFMVGSDTEIASNNLSYLLAAPSRVSDISWIKPGKVAWEWWNCLNISGVFFEAGVNNDTYRHYIDFASRFGIPYVILDEGWAVNNQADLFQIVPEIDLPILVDYARQKDVGIILWAGYYAFQRDMEHVCQHYSNLGIKGFKIDFMDRDDQLAVDFFQRAAETCAKYHLLVDFHGAFKPAGFTRTYPNTLNFEGVFGLEQMKWAPTSVDQMQYDCQIPFIRQTAGPLDYTPGAMLNGGRYNYHPSWMEPMSQGTRCHQLALYIVLDAPLTMLCDSPDNYYREPRYTQFLADIPTVWDETRVLMGQLGEYIVTARRKGDTWYIGGITNWTPRDVEIDLRKLGIATARVELFRDGPNAHRKGSDHMHTELRPPVTTFNVHMAPGGGFVAQIEAY